MATRVQRLASLPEMRASSWYVMQVPAQTPRPIRERLAREVSQILQEPESAAWFEKAKSTPLIGYTPDFHRSLR